MTAILYCESENTEEIRSRYQLHTYHFTHYVILSQSAIFCLIYCLYFRDIVTLKVKEYNQLVDENQGKFRIHIERDIKRIKPIMLCYVKAENGWPMLARFFL